MDGSDEKSADLHIELFGNVRLIRDGALLPSDLPKKARALLACLAIEPGKNATREFMAELLWPERFDKQAQQSLRQALTAIRKNIGDESDAFLIAEGGMLCLDRERVSTDVQVFESKSASLVVEDMGIAIGAYNSDFLTGLGSVSPDFDHWADQERGRLMALALPLFERRVTSLKNSGSVAEATVYATRLVEIDPAHEAGHRQLIRLYLDQGQKSAAFRQYEICLRSLAQLLDASPDSETLALLDQIRAQSDEGGVAQITPEAVQLAGASSGKASGSQPERAFGQAAKQWRLLVAGGVVTAFVLGLFVWNSAPWKSEPAPEKSSEVLAGDDEAELTCAALRSTSQSGEPVLLILPIRSFEDDEFLNMFAASATDAILSVSSSIPGVTFLAGPYLGHPDEKLTPRDLATKNAATHVFETTIRPDADGRRVAMRILEGASGRQIWQSVFTLQDIGLTPGRIQNDMAIRAGRGIQEHLTDGSQALYFARIDPESLELFEHNTRGFGYLSAIQPIYNELAKKEFEAVLAIDPGNPSANTGLGFYYVSPILFRWPGAKAENLELAARHAQASLDVTPDYAPAKNLQAITLLLGGQHERALERMEEGLRLSGSGADSTAFAGYILSFTDQAARSVDMAARAMRLRPYTSPQWYQWSFARSLRLSGDLAGAITCLRENRLSGSRRHCSSA